MDGYALSSVNNLNEPFTIVESLKSLAGALPQAQQQEQEVNERRAVYVTTGAPVPDGFITVVPIEKIIRDNTSIRVEDAGEVREGQFIRKPGSDVKRGMLVLKAG